jgi:glucosamine 6-phosphate synthetase-like amidotransferase/phosphosugar isomerase protein
MCGIAGYSRTVGKSSIPDGRSFARDLARAIESRGPHATGFGWTQNGWPYSWKNPGRASLVANAAPLPTGMTSVLVHTRYATLGNPRLNENNHPIVAPGLILVHNGIVDNHREVLSGLGAEPEGIVDSAAIAHLLSEGPEAYGEDVPTLLQRITGDAAVAWLDGGTGDVLHLARLVSRPLTLGWTKRGDLVFSSTRQTLQDAAKRADITIQQMQDVGEGTYLRVVGGEVVERTRFKPTRRTWVPQVDRTVPSKPAGPKAELGSRARGYAHGVTDLFSATDGTGTEVAVGAIASGRKRWSTAEQRWIEVN